MEWVWCNMCNVAAVVCPNCGNNCCNGGSKESCPDQCASAYAYQAKAYKEKRVPSREECPSVLEYSMDTVLGEGADVKDNDDK